MLDHKARRIALRLSGFGMAFGLFASVNPASAAPARAVTVATDIVEYTCKTEGVTETQNVKVRVELTMPTGAKVGEPLTIGWRGTYVGTGVTAPAEGLDVATNLYAYASISEFQALTSGTGVSSVSTVAPGQVIPLPTTKVDITTTPSYADTGIVRAGGINFGPGPTEPVVNCDVLNKEDLTTYTLVVTEEGGSASPSPTPTPTPTPTPSATPTPTDTAPEADDGVQVGGGANGKVTRTPQGGAGTGGGGEAGPDGRVLVTTGLLLILLAGAGGLTLRRTGARRHRAGSAG
ncbi:hypothetical protein DQ384_26670 [Sphaerisporangium album]|uniref:Uncharacterized protein n=1 Tax=Sphaerisporangium album TaxID=509200 RepID=A0A367FBH1_9ACTN|nr:hypothetical protein [Sphaerisporangium album]RCG27299.1 hypothetical protein DQ384_26670 [Sphaerisporangium album]